MLNELRRRIKKRAVKKLAVVKPDRE